MDTVVFPGSLLMSHNNANSHRVINFLAPQR